ncbi:autotransporter outer membrane beta-barrel domain-containing protein [Achromobacter mucicolens]|uniref:autotransporter family protein n=1 Tax=Achromobacter mucicolens TaxID=1389922 RepID=UPI00244B9A28|nr:autotransporter outer membrane beta-barrel domain-containing protein [Achromobacter mucicolens]MDH0093571.1 autotransporter outer membrane beta-barrel domain-containing protein [Achromobacter mucicolens]
MKNNALHAGVLSRSSLLPLLAFPWVSVAQITIESGETVTVPGTQASPWNTNGPLSVGNAGAGTLNVLSGGLVTSPDAYLGGIAGGAGVVSVTGPNARWEVSANSLSTLNVGWAAAGTLTVASGGVVQSQRGVLGEFDDSVGVVTVTGAGSQWINNQLLFIGMSGEGRLNILDGGYVSTGSGSIGVVGGKGDVTVRGANSRWLSGSPIQIGSLGTGSLTISEGGRVIAPGALMGTTTSGIGKLVIGSDVGTARVAPGTLETPRVSFGPGDSRVVFNHTSLSYVFDATINNGANNAAGSNTGLVGGGRVEAMAGRTILNADHGDFTGVAQIGGAGILQINRDLSGAAIQIFSGGTLEGRGRVGSVVNAGTLSPGASLGTLTISGNYTGSSGSLLQLETVLGNDASPTDKLIVTGNVAGNTAVKVVNLNGSGAQTVNGIRVIEVGGVSSANAFTLRGDYRAENGQQAVIAGAYAYTLQHGGSETPTDGHWYLVSEFKEPGTAPEPEPGPGAPVEEVPGGPEHSPRYQPGTPLYEQYPQVLASLNTLPTLQQRVGNRFQRTKEQPATGQDFEGWIRILGSTMSMNPAQSATRSSRDIDLWKLQTGIDVVAKRQPDGSILVAGVNLSHGNASADVESPYGRGKIDTTGTGVGAGLTWYDASGFYVDGQLQAMWFDSDISSRTIGRDEVKGNNGNGVAISVETGYRFDIGKGFSLTPQAQLIRSRVDFDSFTDPFGAKVRLDDGDNLTGRLGVSLDYEPERSGAKGAAAQTHVYAIANLYNEFMNGTNVNVAGVSFRSRDERLWAELGVGGTYQWSKGRYGVYGNLSVAGATENMSDNHAVGGMIGFRVQW